MLMNVRENGFARERQQNNYSTSCRISLSRIFSPHLAIEWTMCSFSFMKIHSQIWDSQYRSHRAVAPMPSQQGADAQFETGVMRTYIMGVNHTYSNPARLPEIKIKNFFIGLRMVTTRSHCFVQFPQHKTANCWEYNARVLLRTMIRVHSVQRFTQHHQPPLLGV